MNILLTGMAWDVALITGINVQIIDCLTIHQVTTAGPIAGIGPRQLGTCIIVHIETV